MDASAASSFGRDRGFFVTTGIECSAPVVAGGVRQDELRLTGHWDRFDQDFALIASMGMRHVRYGIPFHVVAADPDPRRFDWTWTDRAMASLRAHGLEPIADLLHFGLPDDIPGVADPRLRGRYLAFVQAFVERYPHVTAYTPVNEPWITATFSGREGYWNERAKDERVQARAILNLARCVVEASTIIRSAHPDAVFLQSDVCERWIAGAPGTEDEAALLNDVRFLGFELAYGLPVGERARRWLLESGATEEELEWFLQHGSTDGAIVGHDYYAGNEHVIFAPGRSRVRAPLEGYASLAREYYARLPLPFFLAETNREAGLAPAWLADVWDDAVELVDEGYPIRGVCWYSLTDQVDWDTCLAEVNGNVISLGLVDLDRRPRPVGPMYATLAREAATGRLVRLKDRVEETPLLVPVPGFAPA